MKFLEFEISIINIDNIESISKYESKYLRKNDQIDKYNNQIKIKFKNKINIAHYCNQKNLNDIDSSYDLNEYHLFFENKKLRDTFYDELLLALCSESKIIKIVKEKKTKYKTYKIIELF